MVGLSSWAGNECFDLTRIAEIDQKEERLTSSQSPAQHETAARAVATEPLYVLAYRSHSVMTPEQADVELASILRAARAKNAALDITGALMLYDNWFAQVLEGPEKSVRALFERIKGDKRHTSVEILEQGPTPARAFARWAMAHVGEHGNPDMPVMAVGDKLVPAASWRPTEEQEALLAQLRQATRGYGLGS